MRLIQVRAEDGAVSAAVVEDDGRAVVPLAPATTMYALALAAVAHGTTLADAAAARAGDRRLDYDDLVARRRIAPPLTHPDPRRCLVSLTGLTHLGGAAARDRMHAAANADPATLTDSMRMFRLGLEGGKPAAGTVGVPPEWCFKSDGELVADPWGDIVSPGFSLDIGEEPELAGLYVVAPDRTVVRLGFSLGNEFTDHATERLNYLYLGHSKIRPSSYGPELVTGGFPADLTGTSRIRRNGAVLWEKPFVTGSVNMCHAVENLEHHHFKYPWHRRPGDVHVHYFGTATLSASDGIVLRDGDVTEIEAPGFGRPLVNRVRIAAADPPAIRAL